VILGGDYIYIYREREREMRENQRGGVEERERKGGQSVRNIGR